MNKPIISLIHATRGRPEKCVATAKEWRAKCAEPSKVEHVFGLDIDDKPTLDAIRLLDFSSPYYHYSVVEEHGAGCVAAFNKAAINSVGSVLAICEDDLFPMARWDEAILADLHDYLKRGLPVVLRMRNPSVPDDHRFQPFAMTRARYEQQGYFFFPGYKSVYGDTDLWEQARKDGVIVESPHILMTHAHPYLDKSVPWDDTYEHENASENYRLGKQLFMERNPGVEP